VCIDTRAPRIRARACPRFLMHWVSGFRTRAIFPNNGDITILTNLPEWRDLQVNFTRIGHRGISSRIIIRIMRDIILVLFLLCLAVRFGALILVRLSKKKKEKRKEEKDVLRTF